MISNVNVIGSVKTTGNISPNQLQYLNIIYELPLKEEDPRVDVYLLYLLTTSVSFGQP